jgi:hypothetical protein
MEKIELGEFIPSDPGQVHVFKELIKGTLVDTTDCVYNGDIIALTLTAPLTETQVPEPPPIERGIPVTPALVGWIGVQYDVPSDAKQAAINLVASRDRFGRSKYGQPLMSRDGRLTSVDALQELGDLLQYAYKARLEGESLNEARKILPILLKLLE